MCWVWLLTWHFHPSLLHTANAKIDLPCHGPVFQLKRHQRAATAFGCIERLTIPHGLGTTAGGMANPANPPAGIAGMEVVRNPKPPIGGEACGELLGELRDIVACTSGEHPCGLVGPPTTIIGAGARILDPIICIAALFVGVLERGVVTVGVGSADARGLVTPARGLATLEIAAATWVRVPLLPSRGVLRPEDLPAEILAVVILFEISPI